MFRQLDYALWRSTAHNPVRMLQLLTPDVLERAMARPEWLANYDAAVARLDAMRASHFTWCHREHGDLAGKQIAYFSAEFALHQSLPIYAGGLGVLAGDHCKEASDLGVPLIGVGFMYPQGYFHQSLTADGWQQEVYEKLNWTSAPVEPAITPDGKPCVTAVPLGNRTVLVAVWRVRVGRVVLYLLDTDLEENAPWDRDLSARLYGGDRETRVQQEIILGVGGVRVLKAMGYTPAVYHLNEGHAAFVVAAAHPRPVRGGREFRERARRSPPHHGLHDAHAGRGRSRCVSVPPGRSSSGRRWGDLGGYREQFLALGSPRQRQWPDVQHDRAGNAGQRRHQRRQPAAWRGHQADVAVDLAWCRREKLPIRSITNGVHVSTWVSSEIGALLERSSRSRLARRHDDPAVIDRVMDIPDDELWAARQALRRSCSTSSANVRASAGCMSM